MQRGLHYIAINLAASLCSLIGVALIYGVSRHAEHGGSRRARAGTGATATACYSKLAPRSSASRSWSRPALAAELLAAGCLCAARAPVAAIFAIMTKVGIYAVLRLGSLLAGPSVRRTGSFNDGWLFGIGLTTLAWAPPAC